VQLTLDNLIRAVATGKFNECTSPRKFNEGSSHWKI
jgi:hypothetical protein